MYYKQPTGNGTLETLTATAISGDGLAAVSVYINVTATAVLSSRYAGVVCSATSSNSNGNQLDLTSSGYTKCQAPSGQLLFMVFGQGTDNTQSLPTINQPTGWIMVRNQTAGAAGSANQLRTYVYYRISNGSDVQPAFSTMSGAKCRMTFVIVAATAPNTNSPVGIDAVAAGAAPSTGTITLPAITTSLANTMLLSYATQNIGSNNYVMPAGLATATIAGQGGQAITMLLAAKDIAIAKSTMSYGITTSQTGNAYVAGQVLINPS